MRRKAGFCQKPMSAIHQAANRSGAHGSHRYTPEQYGLDPDEIRRNWQFYVQHFDVEVDD